jgi:hypothetical protein
MKRFFSHTELRSLSFIFALLLLLSSIPLSSGVVTVPTPSYPEFTINICQPIQAIGSASNTILARPSPDLTLVLFYLGWFEGMTALKVVERSVAPETPPPKPVV